MTKHIIDCSEISNWKNKYHIYTSQPFNGKSLKFLMNNFGIYKITYGSKIIYQGSQLTHAIAAWESV